MKTTTDYTDCTDYLAKATINLDLTDWLRTAISGVSRNNQNESMQSKSVKSVVENNLRNKNEYTFNKIEEEEPLLKEIQCTVIDARIWVSYQMRAFSFV